MTSRRDFLQTSAAAIGSFAVGGAFQEFMKRTAMGSVDGDSPGYGPLLPAKDATTGLELLRLPEGFRYITFGWTGDPMDDGRKTPPLHDGMAVISEADGILTLTRNHEVSGSGKPFADAERSYDAQAPGGCTQLLFDTRQERWLKSWSALSGTSRNCAGGPTPWGTWLTCEETVLGPGDRDKKGKPYRFEQTHGWIFEVPAETAAAPLPLKDMGRFVHEAVAVDPDTGYVYETEDRGSAGFFRFLPHEKGRLAAGGRLQMLKAAGRENLKRGIKVGETIDVSWVDIDDPYRAHSPGKNDEQGVYHQGRAQGAATFARLEGCWYGNRRIYLVSTSGGEKGAGQVWQYDPREEQLQLLFESPGADVLDNPDNIAVSSRGGLILCEDGSAESQRLHGLTPEGELFPFAENHIVLAGERNGIRGNFAKEEWAGATFSPDGNWLFVNNQTPGITFAITGPWEAGQL